VLVAQLSWFEWNFRIRVLLAHTGASLLLRLSSHSSVAFSVLMLLALVIDGQHCIVRYVVLVGASKLAFFLCKSAVKTIIWVQV